MTIGRIVFFWELLYSVYSVSFLNRNKNSHIYSRLQSSSLLRMTDGSFPSPQIKRHIKVKKREAHVELGSQKGNLS